MDRRDALKASAAAIVGSGVKVQAEELKDSDIAIVLTVPDDITDCGLEQMRESWRAGWTGPKSIPVVIIPEGVTFHVVRRDDIARIEERSCTN